MLSETIATGKTDQPLKDAILKLSSFAISYPWVEEWLEGCRQPFHIEDLDDFDGLPMAETLLDYLKNLTSQWEQQMKQCRNICLMEDGPAAYEKLMQQEVQMMGQFIKCRTYEDYYEKIQGVSFARLPALRKFAGDIAKKERVQKMRNEVKDSYKKLKEQFFFQQPEKMVEDMKRNRLQADMLIDVTLDFLRAFSEKKREKSMLDFNDLEHFALKILVDEKTHLPSQTAQELRRNYEEIMIDEYQDSNLVQETVLRAVSMEEEGGHNIFMVGDVKQSIYRFRMARPELFMEKYGTYTTEESENQRIDLHKNFRSRPEVLNTVNDIFRKLMNEDIGNITYDDQAALYPGASYPQGEPGTFDTRFLVVQPGEEEKDVKTPELEAKAVGTEIRRLIKEQLVCNENPTETCPDYLRLVRYGDIVILLRSMSGWADAFVHVLGEMGIPAWAAAGTGYFSALEVQTALNLLKILDNPRQDIPMAAVLSSPIAGLTGKSWRLCACSFRRGRFMRRRCMIGSKILIIQGFPWRPEENCRNFYSFCRNTVKRSVTPPSTSFLYEILEETGYQAYVYALPGGEVKKANLEMLVERAIAYENTSYRGLFHFIRYMEQLQKYEVDYPLADGDEAEDVVRIMSIHKSKGLEFPVVFVSGLGKMFNNQDVRERLVLHPSLGIGMDVLDFKRRLKTPGFTRQLLARKIAMENTGEELRVLYVALTRAKERLILTGS